MIGVVAELEHATVKPAREMATIAACVLAAANAAAGELVRVRDVRMPMGTYMAITVYASDEAAGKKAIAAAFDRVEQVEAVISTWRRKSDASKLIRAAGKPPIVIHPHLYALLARAIEVSEETGGAFDVTAGPLIQLWKRAHRIRRLPPDDVIAAARARVGYRYLRLILQGRKAQLTRKNMRIDLGAIGKGYSIDQAVAVLRAAGISAALVDAGGDIYALGAPPGRAGWLVGVRDPQQPSRILAKPLLVKDCAAATSGDYEQFVELDGRRFSHILDPRTGWPVEGVSSVTVIAPDATTADAYATAVSVLGPKAAVAFAEKRPHVELLILHKNGDKVARTRSSGFGRYESDRGAKQ